MATGVRTGAVDEPLGWNRRSPAENGSKSLKGGRTVREGALTSGTAAADLEREGEASSAGLSAGMRGLSVVGTWRGIAYSENAPLAYCILRPAFGRAMRRHNKKGIGQ